MTRSLIGPTIVGVLTIAAVLTGITLAALSIGGLPFAAAIAIGVTVIGAMVAIGDRDALHRFLGRSESEAPTAQLSGERAELYETLATVDIFRGLPDSARLALAQIGEIRDVPEGQVLGSEGEVGEHLYVVLEGRAHLSANSPVGHITARIAGPGESMPLAALLGDGRLITTVQAGTGMTVWQVQRDVLKQHFREDSSTGAHVYRQAAAILAERYRTTMWRLTQSAADVVKGDTFWVNV